MILDNTEIKQRNERIPSQILHFNKCNLEEKKIVDKQRLKNTIDLIVTTVIVIASYILIFVLTDFKIEFNNVPILMITGIFMSSIYIFSILSIRIATFERYKNKKSTLEQDNKKINKVTESIKYLVLFVLFIAFLCFTVEMTTIGVYQVILSEI